MMMAEVESAEEFVYHLDTLSSATQAKLVDARDTAIREAARLEALFELKRLVETSKWLDLANRKESGWGRAYQSAMKELETKYQSADSRPAQDGERR